MHGGPIVALVFSMPYQVMIVLGGLDVGRRLFLGASYMADGEPLVCHVCGCLCGLFCLCAMMSIKRVCDKEQNLSRRVLEILL